jgi:hypothetical protein
MGAPAAGATVLTDAEKRRLLDIALNTSRTPSTYASAGFDLDFGHMDDPWAAAPPMPTRTIRPSRLTDSPQRQASLHTMTPSGRPSLSRQTTANTLDASMSASVSASASTPASMGAVSTATKQADSSRPKEKARAGDRSGHNDIERKYRTNLKDKISELRDAVPALRNMVEEAGGEDDAHRGMKVSKVSHSHPFRPQIMCSRCRC